MTNHTCRHYAELFGWWGYRVPYTPYSNDDNNTFPIFKCSLCSKVGFTDMGYDNTASYAEAMEIIKNDKYNYYFRIYL